MPKRKTKRQNLTIPMRLGEGEDFEVEKAAVYPEGLAVHKIVQPDPETSQPHQGKLWVITHTASGYNMGVVFDTQRHAKKVAEKLLDLPIDWTKGETPHGVLTPTEKIMALEVLERYMYEEPSDEEKEKGVDSSP